MDPIIVQVSAFIVMFVAGVTLGFMFDLYRLVRAAVHPRGVLDGLFDFLFWCITAPVMIGFIFYGNWGDLRVYVFVAITLGAMFYFGALGRPVRGIVRKTMRLMGLAVRMVGRGTRKGLIAPLLWAWDCGATVMDRLAERREMRKPAMEAGREGAEGVAAERSDALGRERRRHRRDQRKGSS